MLSSIKNYNLFTATLLLMMNASIAMENNEAKVVIENNNKITKSRKVFVRSLPKISSEKVFNAFREHKNNCEKESKLFFECSFCHHTLFKNNVPIHLLRHLTEEDKDMYCNRKGYDLSLNETGRNKLNTLNSIEGTQQIFLIENKETASVDQKESDQESEEKKEDLSKNSRIQQNILSRISIQNLLNPEEND